MGGFVMFFVRWQCVASIWQYVALIYMKINPEYYKILIFADVLKLNE